MCFNVAFPRKFPFLGNLCRQPLYCLTHQGSQVTVTVRYSCYHCHFVMCVNTEVKWSTDVVTGPECKFRSLRRTPLLFVLRCTTLPTHTFKSFSFLKNKISHLYCGHVTSSQCCLSPSVSFLDLFLKKQTLCPSLPFSP